MMEYYGQNTVQKIIDMQFKITKPYYQKLFALYVTFLVCFFIRIVYTNIIMENLAQHQALNVGYEAEWIHKKSLRTIIEIVLMSIEFVILSIFFVLEIVSEV